MDRKGTLRVGKDADLNVFDRDMALVSTYSLGRHFTKVDAVKKG
jgi:N-acetylglucosamine-6-phosphate deacetylase